MPPFQDNQPETRIWKSGSPQPIREGKDPGRAVQFAILEHGPQGLVARKAFQDVHRLYLPFTYALAARKAHVEDVEDIIQETWLAVWRRLLDQEPVERFIALLEVICRNKVADANERRYRRKRLAQRPDHSGSWMVSLDDPVNPALPEGDRWTESLQSTEPGPEMALLEQERSDKIWRLVERLPENWRLAITYRFFNQMSVVDTAKAMNTTEDAIKKYVFRAVRRLREWMGHDLEFWLK